MKVGGQAGPRFPGTSLPQAPPSWAQGMFKKSKHKRIFRSKK